MAADRIKRYLYSTVDIGNHENSNAANLVRLLAHQAQLQLLLLTPCLYILLNLWCQDVLDEPTEEERIETTGTPLKKFTTLENVSVACTWDTMIEIKHIAIYFFFILV